MVFPNVKAPILIKSTRYFFGLLYLLKHTVLEKSTLCDAVKVRWYLSHVIHNTPKSGVHSALLDHVMAAGVFVTLQMSKVEHSIGFSRTLN